MISVSISRFGKNMLLASVLAVGACSQNDHWLGDAFGGGPRISDSAWLKRDTAATAATPSATTTGTDVGNAGYVPDECSDSNVKKSVDPQDPIAINKCVDAMVLLINIRWYHFAANLTAVTNGTNFVLDLAQLGLGGAGSLAGKSAAQILSAINGGLGGTKTAIDSDLLLKNSITVVIHQMIADRATDYIAILNREAAGKKPGACTTPPPAAPPPAAVVKAAAKPKKGAATAPAAPAAPAADAASNTETGPYCSIEDAEKDLFQYAMDGSWMNALSTLQTSTAATAQDCTNKLKQTKAALSQGTTPPPAGNGASQSGSSGCPTSSTNPVQQPSAG